MVNTYESFNIIFSSRGANVLNNADLNNVVFFVNWGSILPKKYKKFRCQFVFKSENYAGALLENGFVDINFTRANVYDGYSNVNRIGFIYPVQLNANAYFFSSTNNDNNDFSIDYPNNQTITISLKTFAGANMQNMPHYALVLNLIGIPEDEDNNAN